jgi:predicted  nucleic acid-binding Zn-ribbon protein
MTYTAEELLFVTAEFEKRASGLQSMSPGLGSHDKDDIEKQIKKLKAELKDSEEKLAKTKNEERYGHSVKSLKKLIRTLEEKKMHAPNKVKKESFVAEMSKLAHRFEAPNKVRLQNMKAAEPNEDDKKEIQQWLEEEEQRLADLRKKK